jgi:hypothetical protein
VLKAFDSNVHDPIRLRKVEVDDVKCRKRLHCFTQVLYAVITNFLAARKKREIESCVLT